MRILRGIGYRIAVQYLDSDNEQYIIIYDESNNYSEKEYSFTIIPKFEDGTIASNASILIDGIATGELGQQHITIKRNKQTLISASVDSTSNNPTETVMIKNPNKIEYNYDEQTKTYNIELILE